MSVFEEMECQNHANCGDYCETEREREMVLCEDCLDSFDQRQADLAELKKLRVEVTRMREVLTEADDYLAGNNLNSIDSGSALHKTMRDTLSGTAPAEPVNPYDRPGHDALWHWFAGSRSSYAVLPRVMMHDMPDAWQADMARLMDAWDDTWINQPNIGCRVQITDADGKLMKTPDWMLNYRHPNCAQLAMMRKKS